MGAFLSFAAVFTTFWLGRSRPKSEFYVDYLRRKLGSDGPFMFEVEIAADALVTRQLGAATRHEWSSVERVREAKSGLEIDLRGGSLVFVRDSGFASAEERSEFLRQAREWSARGKRL
jgi:hypothetical protein